MNPPSVDIKDILVADIFLPFQIGLDMVLGTTLFLDQEPAKPNKCVTIYDTGGFDRIPNVEYEQPTVQIRTRAAQGDFLIAYKLAKGISDLLHELTNETLDDSRIIAIWQMGDILRAGSLDDSDRPAFTANFRIHRTPI